MNHQRVIIAGVPGSGKTTLGNHLSNEAKLPLMSSDDLIHWLLWSDLSKFIAERAMGSGPWVMEGVATIRAVRKWLKANEKGAPCDTLYFLTRSFDEEENSRRQGMGKACLTIFEDIKEELEARGTCIYYKIPDD